MPATTSSSSGASVGSTGETDPLSKPTSFALEIQSPEGSTRQFPPLISWSLSGQPPASAKDSWKTRLYKQSAARRFLCALVTLLLHSFLMFHPNFVRRFSW